MKSDLKQCDKCEFLKVCHSENRKVRIDAYGRCLDFQSKGKKKNSLEIIENIKDDMCCANACPQWNKAHYDIYKCTCYKKEVIEAVCKMSGIVVFVIERKDMKNPGCVMNKYVGDCGEGTRGFNVDFEKAYKFHDRQSAQWFIEHQAVRESKELFDPDEFCITEHEMVS